MESDYKFKPDSPVEFYKAKPPKGTRSKLICLPFYRYAVQSPFPKLKAVDIFEKAVLGLLQIKQQTPGEIGQLLRLDKKLILLLIAQLQQKRMLDSNGRITTSGKNVLEGEDHYWALENSNFTTGYVYQNPISAELYPRFNKTLSLAETVWKEGARYPKLSFGTKGSPRKELPFFCSLNEKLQLLPKTPAGRAITTAVCKHGRAIALGEFVGSTVEIPPELDKVSLLEEKPELVWLATYVYVLESEKYLDVFHVLDPFGLGANRLLSDYLKEISEGNPFLKKEIESLFCNFENQRIEEFSAQKKHLKESAHKEITKRFGLYLKHTDALFLHLKKLEIRFLDLKMSNGKGSIAKEANVVFERIFKNMIKENWRAYRNIHNCLVGNRSAADKDHNQEIINDTAELLGADTPLPIRLLIFDKQKIRNTVKHYKTSGSLTGMLTASILAAETLPNHPLRNMLRENAQTLHQIVAFSAERNKDPSVHDSKTTVSKDLTALAEDRTLIYSIVNSFLQ